jgi:hypothetical protein
MSVDTPPSRHFPSNIHWIDHCAKNHFALDLGHKNPPRISAVSMLRLINLKNNMLGIKRSLYEESLIDEEANL